ncbi:nitrate reductase [Pseudooceanicola sp. 502str34]
MAQTIGAKTICTTCPYCGTGCGVLATPDGRGGLSVKGDTAHPANLGRLCSKGSALGETVSLEGRALDPVFRGSRIKWDDALDLVAAKFLEAVDEHGPDSVAFYVSGQILTEDYYVANKLMKGYLGSANIDTNSRLCMASSVAGHKRAFGTDTVPGTYEDLEEADLVVLVGSNLAWCHPVLYQRLVSAKKMNPALKVVNIDPRRTATSDIADLHLSVRPDGDVALFNGLLAQIVDRGAEDRDWIDAHVSGAGQAIATAQAGDPAESGLSAEDLAQFYDLWIGTEKVVTMYSQGVNQSSCGADKVNAILNCHLATGRIGRPGMGPFSVTGQPNAMGGREVGGLANMLACHLDIENAAHRDAVQEAWGSPRICDHAGLKAVDLFRACGEGRIKALWIMGTNPAVSLPDAEAVSQAIARVPFVVVSDVLAETDTTRLADLVLPALAWGEKSGTVTNSERMISRQRALLPAPGQARADWQIIAQVADRMGWGDHFAYGSAADIFREYAALSGLGKRFDRDFDISGLKDITDAAYDAFQPIRWPVAEPGAEGGRFFADGQFYHADKRARMLPVAAPAVQDLPRGFHLNSGRIRDQWHTMTRTGRSARLSQHLGEPFVEIHPEDAKAQGLGPADLARLTSDTGEAILRVLITDRAARGSVFVPIHWTLATGAAGRVGPLVQEVTDPVSGQPASKQGRVDVALFSASWYGFAASSATCRSARPYWSVARTATGWSAELAGLRAPRDWEAEARYTLGLETGTASLLEDPRKGTVRVAIHDEAGVLQGLFFAATRPVEVARRHAVEMIGTKVAAVEALAGRPGADRPDPGATVCSCYTVGVNTLRAAVAGGADTVEKLGRATCAGTNCGSCKPELQALIDAMSNTSKVAAE